MSNCFRIIEEEIKRIKKIQADETWYEGERQHCQIAANDTTVLQRVEQIVIQNIDKIEHEVFQQVCFDCENKAHCINLLRNL